MRRAMLMKLQSLFCLPKIELWEGRKKALSIIANDRSTKIIDPKVNRKGSPSPTGPRPFSERALVHF
jgi:hypothetical protein